MNESIKVRPARSAEIPTLAKLMDRADPNRAEAGRAKAFLAGREGR
jgi:hypothetical protein